MLVVIGQLFFMKNYGVTFFWIRRNEVDPSQPTQLCSTTRDLLKLDFPHSAKAKSSGMQSFLLKIEMVAGFCKIHMLGKALQSFNYLNKIILFGNK